ncbi:protein rolling stone-like, partial [Tubulanus polymorphus]|uniref:protein rolling stone-like n=1 Tax=Tubulanus polymorphus TaxID=672921 RepID=UPI003DA2C51D
QWNLPPIIFLIYRFLVSAYVFGWFVYSLSKSLYFMITLTTWSFLILALHLLLAFINSSCRVLREKRSCFRRPRDESDPFSLEMAESSCSTPERTVDGSEVDIVSSHTIPWNFKLDWLLYSICSVAAIMVTTVYYALLFPTGQQAPSVRDINVHIMNSVIVFLEILLAAYPVRLLHFIYPVSYGLIYVMFSAIFWSFDPERNVLYPGVLDWNNPKTTTGMVVGIAVFMIVLHLILYGIFRLKVFLYNRFLI